jgi:hypothetical protein
LGFLFMGKTNKSKFKPEMVAEIEKYASLGLWIQDIANIIGYNETYFYDLKKLHPEIDEAIKVGRSKLKANLLARIRTAGDQQWQACAWLSERLWQDEFAIKSKIEHSGNMTVSFDKQDEAL